MTPTEIQAWDRQPHESSRAFAAWVHQRDLEPSARSLTEVARIVHETSTRRGGTVDSVRRQLWGAGRRCGAGSREVGSPSSGSTSLSVDEGDAVAGDAGR
jgi:hypothetical protein